jgi:hypothetical protein
MAEGEIQVWAEGLVPAPVKAGTRLELERCSRLAVWTAPPGQQEWEAVLDLVQPDEIYLFAIDWGMDQRGPFLQELSGIVKFALRARQGQVEIGRAAARMGHRCTTIEAGLEHLEAAVILAIVARGEEYWQVESGTRQLNAKEIRQRGIRLDALLAETSAYRSYMLHAPSSALVRPTFGD